MQNLPITTTGQAIHTTRRVVLDALRAAGQASINQLAESLGIKGITIRHHLAGLQAEGLVEVEEKRQSVGRPVHVYRLTDQAESLFPQKYHELVERLLDQVKQTFPPETVERLIASLAASVADDVKREFEHLPPEERQRRLIELLAREGFMARWRHTDEGLKLVEYHCPYYRVGQRHPEICRIDETLIRVAMNSEVSKEACLLSGDPACTFVVTSNPIEVSSSQSLSVFQVE